jgi:hypothetical protein
VCPKPVIIGYVLGQQTREMAFVAHDHMVEHVASDTANAPFTVWILPGAVRHNLDLFDAHVADALLEMLTVDCVSIPEEIPGRFVPRKRFDDLLRGPLRGGMFCDIDGE